uniref:SET domain-containing protein n=1 Tax=Ditylum brightwellii TaxID=49249 RepID=A0A7S1YVE7_9STRA
MFNHGSAETEVEYVYDEDGNCYVQTIRDVPAGSPLRMSYGDPTNPSFLFARYGFLDESSPATFCKLIPSHISEEMQNIGYAHNRMLFFKDSGDVSQEVWDVLLYQVLGENDEWKQKEFYEAHMNGDYDTKESIHEQYRSQTMAKLLDHIDSFLYQLEKLSEKTYGRSVDDHPRLPLILRHNEFVRDTFLTVRSRYFE